MEDIKVKFGKVVRDRITEDMYYNDFDEVQGKYVWKVAEHNWTIEVSIVCDGETDRIGQLEKRIGGDIDMPGYEMIVDEDLIDKFPDLHDTHCGYKAAEAKRQVEKEILEVIAQALAKDTPAPSEVNDDNCVKCGGYIVECEA